MASLSKGTSFTDGVTGDVTAAKLHALVDSATPVAGLILDRTNETVIGTDDVIMISDTSESGALNKITVENLFKAPLTGTINSTAGTITAATIPTLTAGTTTGTAATFTTGTITTGIIPTLTAGTTTSTAATITTGTIPTLVATTLITSGTGTAAAPAISPTGDSNTGIFFPAADTIAFSEGGTEAMRIDSSGNVGIGTSITTAQLTIAKGVNSATLPSTPTNHSITLYPPLTTGYYGGGISWSEGSNTAASICAVDDGTSGALGLVLSTGSNLALTERLRIDSNGNVGIGATNPSDKLTVRGTNGVAATIDMSSGISSGTEYGSLKFTASSPNFTGAEIRGIHTNGGTNLGVLAFHTSATERLRIDSSGQVGIGTSPSSQLDVRVSNPSRGIVGSFVNTATSSQSGAQIRITQNGIEDWVIGQPAATNAFSIWSGRSNETDGTERLRIDSSGNVLVKSTAGLGYGTGAGGTVTQSTNKATGVTLNKPTGQITTSTATLNANTTVSFVLTNSIIASTDTISINHTSGGTGSSYLAWASGISAGSASINLRNITAGNLSDSLVLNFNVIKGATS